MKKLESFYQHADEIKMSYKKDMKKSEQILEHLKHRLRTNLYFLEKEENNEFVKGRTAELQELISYIEDLNEMSPKERKKFKNL